MSSPEGPTALPPGAIIINNDDTGTGDTRRFYDDLAANYHLIYADWDASIERQATALDTVITAHLGPGPHRILDGACGIGTQSLGLARLGHRVTGTDLSPAALRRARLEAARRNLHLPLAAADLRALPFPSGRFDVALCADNVLPHLLTPDDLHAGLTSLHRVLRPGGLLVASTRPYDALRETHPHYSPPWISQTDAGRTIAFQLWTWHPDGARYDLEHFTLTPDGNTYDVTVGRATYWAITQPELTAHLTSAGFTAVEWHTPEDSGFFQPVVTAQRR